MRRALGVWMLLIVAAVAGISAVPARAETTIEVVVETLTPQLFDLTKPDQRVTLTGRLRNTSDSELGNVSVHFWRSTTPIKDHDELEQALTSEATQPLGRRLPESNQDQNNAVYVGDVAAGAELPFTVSATVADLTLPSNDMAYLLGVHVRGNLPTGVRQTVARSRVLAVAASAPLPTTTVVKLTTAPTLVGGTDFRDDSLRERLNGELSGLLEAAERPGAYVLLDPAFLAEVRTLAAEHSIAGEPRAASQQAKDYATRLDSLMTEGRVQRLPFGNPDLPRLHASGGLAAVEEALAWSATALDAEKLGPVEKLPLAADLGDFASQDLALTLSLHGFSTIYGNNIAISGRLESTDDQAQASALRTEAYVLPGVGPGDTMTEAQTTGRRLAEDLLGATQPVRMIRSTDDALEAQPLAGFEIDSLPPTLQTPARFEEVADVVAWPELDQSLGELFHEAQLMQELTGTDRSATNAAVAARASSANFGSEDEALAYLNATPTEQLDPSHITLSVPNQVVMGSDTNFFPVTVHNLMQVSATVRVHFTSDAQGRLKVLPSELVTIAPGQHATINVTTVTTANGVVTVRGQLATAAGTRFGPEVPVEITATGLGRVGWIIIIISGAVVLGGTVLRIRAVQRERARVNREQ